jgi:hypothetical protein
MTRFRLLGLTLVAVCALSAVLSATALALPEALPFSSGTKAFTGKLDSGEAIFENSGGNQFKCKKAESSGELGTDTLGTYKLNFEECSLQILGTTETCAGSGDRSAVILSEGSFHYVFDTLGTGETLGVAVLFLPHETSFECGTFVKNNFKGTLLCLLLTPLTGSLTHLFHCTKGSGAGTSAIKTYYNDSGTAATAQLLLELDGGGFKEANLQLLATLTTKEASAIMNE